MELDINLNVVSEFLEKANTQYDEKSLELYVKLIQEESLELLKALIDQYYPDEIDAIVDCLWVVTACALIMRGKKDGDLFATPTHVVHKLFELETEKMLDAYLLLKSQEATYQLSNIRLLIQTLLAYAIKRGFDIVGAWEELTRSNMTKVINPVFDENGKLVKTADFSPANFEPFCRGVIR